MTRESDAGRKEKSMEKWEQQVKGPSPRSRWGKRNQAPEVGVGTLCKCLPRPFCPVASAPLSLSQELPQHNLPPLRGSPPAASCCSFKLNCSLY